MERFSTPHEEVISESITSGDLRFFFLLSLQKELTIYMYTDVLFKPSILVFSIKEISCYVDIKFCCSNLQVLFP